MFRGISHITVDTKGRLAMPTKYRDVIAEIAGGQIVITVDHTDKCLLVYPMDQWVKVEKTLMSLPNMNRRVRNMQRLILGYAAELELDAQGRVLLPAPLREYAGLDKRVVLVGQANKFELWDADGWDAAREAWLLEAQEDSETNDILNQVSM
ncbi:MAG TPA: division/cell wall cluster transcriptional repressor MraZ [Candidatus Thiothrix moscowensis]|uniref:division/cell wall cluster transcriptional repressor MraZ n=1 Tax=unclassified Thiothrix TaxID=2636184 RepID=UPI0025EBE994|nr:MULTISPECIES: division/cell wall cluster transcriptional repressor MraZ [unclassified Thiothrix]HRJ51658.1 division/cell wall cluster transcriptional repressor MraZ [Candidatus Thiothrix moscowensis]HRJ91973.1 division/cell wall cluster transcriptional repressor MraZ [Candidatus Thiothrix moscowensis]